MRFFSKNYTYFLLSTFLPLIKTAIHYKMKLIFMGLKNIWALRSLDRIMPSIINFPYEERGERFNIGESPIYFLFG
jgi:predicted choloylglycine hydrolase